MDNQTEQDSTSTTAYSCNGCGAPLSYKPGSTSLVCKHCGNTQEIPKEDNTIHELDFEKFVDNIESENMSTTKVVMCSNCKATPTVDENLKSMMCPYCGSPLVETNVKEERYIKPSYVAPFQINKDDVNGILKRWSKGLWFAPNKLQRAVLSPLNLHGIYVPYWTFDADVKTAYTGERGDAYYVTVGSGDNRHQERRVRWSFSSGTIETFYDDVLVPASRSLNLNLLQKAGNWNAKSIVKINESYLAGFITEKYQVNLKDGFVYAKQMIDNSEQNRVRQDIGGDEQRIHSMNTAYDNIKFKHVLLPIYVSAFRYKNKLYTFYVNGFTGHIAGQRPYSNIKIALAVIAALIVVSVLYFLDQKG